MKKFVIERNLPGAWNLTPNPFSEAISEGIKETFKEMGYKVRLNDKT